MWWRCRGVLLFGLCLLALQCPAWGKDAVEQQGDVLKIALPAIALGATLFYEEDYDGSIQWFQAFVTSEATVYALKKVVDKERPNGNCCSAFPSGHASMAFMGAAFIQRRYGWGYGVPAYLAAAYVGYTRIESDKHDTLDVAAGALIGILSSYYFVEPYQGIQITPYAAGGSYGLMLSGRW
ncbi:phosphatase PAP2 family protein [Shewanella sedimentimangrovi]|uniref:Phosphatase PAP2 family protein n=1 Tax=Shewanella sedimentimangrovi TaxID=2814293 RepID=A0ABX7R195_9GAMM|nr:phosphatase PAP2 family protein [Shewanella sedimentimangrovi]QSX37072.1 phosphatase PAP2 family protein [Shewanella sedimentimangrovi]